MTTDRNPIPCLLIPGENWEPVSFYSYTLKVNGSDILGVYGSGYDGMFRVARFTGESLSGFLSLKNAMRVAETLYLTGALNEAN